MIEKYKQGPVGMLTVFPSGPPAMPKFLGLWFAYSLIIAFSSHISRGAPSRPARTIWWCSALQVPRRFWRTAWET